MAEGSDYQKTIAFLCRDFLEQMDEMPQFINENDLLDRITYTIIEEGDEDLFHIRNLEAHMFKYESRLLSLYSKNPDNIRLDALRRRAESLRAMCLDLLRETRDEGK